MGENQSSEVAKDVVVKNPVKLLQIASPNYRAVIQAPHYVCMLAFANQFGWMKRDYNFSNISHTIIATARQMCVDQALSNPDVSHVLFVDDDMIFTPGQYFDLEREMVMNDLDFISALCFANCLPTKPCLFGRNLDLEPQNGNPRITEFGEHPWWHTLTDYPRKQRFPVYATGFGMVLITTRLLDRMRRDGKGEPIPYYQHFKFNNEMCPNEDIAFCLQANRAGAELWCDSRISIGHLSKDMPVISEEVYDAHGDALESAVEMRRCQPKRQGDGYSLDIEFLDNLEMVDPEKTRPMRVGT